MNFIRVGGLKSLAFPTNRLIIPKRKGNPRSGGRSFPWMLEDFVALRQAAAIVLSHHGAYPYRGRKLKSLSLWLACFLFIPRCQKPSLNRTKRKLQLLPFPFANRLILKGEGNWRFCRRFPCILPPFLFP